MSSWLQSLGSSNYPIGSYWHISYGMTMHDKLPFLLKSYAFKGQNLPGKGRNWANANFQLWKFKFSSTRTQHTHTYIYIHIHIVIKLSGHSDAVLNSLTLDHASHTLWVSCVKWLCHALPSFIPFWRLAHPALAWHFWYIIYIYGVIFSRWFGESRHQQL